MPDERPDDDAPRPWRILEQEPGEPMMLFRPRVDTVLHPRSGETFRRLVLETPDWVNVVARDERGRFVLVEQYRFGSGTVTLELPGGMIDLGEAHGDAARRELREETGHTGGRWTYLGSVQPNPAFHTNRCHHWLAEGCRPTEALDLDPGEDIAVHHLDEAELRAAIADGRVAHSLVLTALARVLDLRGPA